MDDPGAGPAWAWSVTRFPRPKNVIGVTYPPIPNVKETPTPDISPTQPEHQHREPPEDIRRVPQGRTCLACGRTDCNGHPKIES